MLRALSLLLCLLLGAVVHARVPVLVSVAPQRYLVEAIGGDHVSVEVIVPSGANPHIYEPSPKQMMALSQGAIWFRLGESFEERLVRTWTQMVVVDQREGLDLLEAECCGHKGAADPHIWLSPRLLQRQAEQIAHTLALYDPLHAAEYHAHQEQLVHRLIALDQELSERLRKAPRTLLVSHPAFGYLCRDYGLTQLSVEMEGKEPTPRYLAHLISTARRLNIRTLFLQKQYAVRGGIQVSKALNARCLYLDPYAENVIENLREIAQAFCQ